MTVTDNDGELVAAWQRLQRALADTTSVDLEAFAAGAPISVTPPAAAWPLVTALGPVSLAGGRRLPVPQPLAQAAEQSAEKAEVASHTVSLTLAPFTFHTYALATNLALQAQLGADYVRSLFAASVASAVDAAVAGELQGAGAAAADWPAAWTALYGAGWRRMAVVISPGVAMSDPTTFAAMAQLGTQVVSDPNVTSNLLIALDGVALAVDGPTALTGPPEPGLVGEQVGAYASYSLAMGAGAVQVVA